MNALLIDVTIARYLFTKGLAKLIKKPWLINGISTLCYKDIPEPKLINDEWVKIKTILSGICGSDLSTLQSKESLSLEPFFTTQFVLGHENYGIIEEIGPKVKGFTIGDRVVIDSVLSCVQRGITPLCNYCSRGDFSLCSNLTTGNISPGLYIGTNKDTGGGWSKFFVAHHSQLIKVPKEISDEEAVLTDSFASALHPVMRNKPKDRDTVVIYGGGVIGLMTIASIRGLDIKAKIILVAKYDFQGEMGKRLGADIIINPYKGNLYEEIRGITNAKIFKPTLGLPVLLEGPDIVFDCVGSRESIENSLHILNAKGKLVIIATTGKLNNIDWALIWFKELIVTGSNSYNLEDYNGNKKRTFEVVMDILVNKKVDIKPLLTHTFPLHDYKRGLTVAMEKKKYNSIKCAFDLRS